MPIARLVSLLQCVCPESVIPNKPNLYLQALELILANLGDPCEQHHLLAVAVSMLRKLPCRSGAEAADLQGLLTLVSQTENGISTGLTLVLFSR